MRSEDPRREGEDGNDADPELSPGQARRARRQERRDEASWKTSLAEMGAVLVAALLLAVNAVQAYSNNRAANAAQIAAQTAEDTLIASSRPWVGFTDISLERLELQPNPQPALADLGMSIRAAGTLKIENFGNSPATNVSPARFAVVLTVGTAPPPHWTELACQATEQSSRGAALTSVVMPKDTIERRFAYEGEAPRQSPSPYHAWLLGCIAYQDSLHGSMHHTRILMYSNYSSAAASSFATLDSSAD